MRKLTDNDLANITGTTVEGYHIEAARVKRGPFTDSDHYGYILGKNDKNHYVCWQFHLDDYEKPNVYWGNYFMEDREAAIRNFNIRDLDSKTFTVTITETLKRAVEVKAKDQQEAEQIVSDNWKKSEYVLDADNFVGLEFTAITIDEQESGELTR